MNQQRTTRFGGLVLVANEFRFLPAVVGQLLKVCDRVILVRSMRAFSGKPVELDPVPRLDRRVEIIQGDWSEGEARNRGIDFLGVDCDYIFTLDSDEILTVKALEFLKSHISRGHRAVACNLETYWKSPRWKIHPPDQIPAVVMVSRAARFRFMRVLDMEPNVVHERLIHHLSYVRTDEELRDKLLNYGHAEQVIPGWFETVWKKWDVIVEAGGDLSGFLNFHPINRRSFASAKPVVCQELEAILQEYRVS